MKPLWREDGTNREASPPSRGRELKLQALTHLHKKILVAPLAGA